MLQAEAVKLVAKVSKLEVEAARGKIGAMLALERERRSVVEIKLAKVEKKFEGEVVEAECLTVGAGYLIVEALKASSEFTEIKVEFYGEAFKGGFETCKQKIADHCPEWDLSFLDELGLLNALELRVTEELPLGVVSDEVPAQTIEASAQALGVSIPIIEVSSQAAEAFGQIVEAASSLSTQSKVGGF